MDKKKKKILLNFQSMQVWEIKKTDIGGKQGFSALTYLNKLIFKFPSMHSASILSPISLLLTQDDTDGVCAEMELGIFVLLRFNEN